MRVAHKSILTSIGIALAAVLAVAPPATAGPPTRIVDHTMDVFCTAVSDGVEITVRAELSELAGTAGVADLSTPTGDFIAYGSAESDWADGSVRTSIPVYDNDNQTAGDVYFSASFAPDGAPNVIKNKFRDGNVHVVEEHSETSLRVGDVVLTYGDITFTDVRCEGWIVDGSLFFTNPAVHVSFSSNLLYECTATNLSSWFVSGPLDDLFVDVEYADVERAQASGIVDVEEGSSWNGEWDVQVADEPAGTVGVTATLGRSGRPIHVTDDATGMRSHAHLTPYPFTLELDGPGAPATLDCTLYAVRLTWREPNAG